ncbi:aromatic ring-hydroxylating dioxygenase subunit alpha [Amycolatopsis acidicola]|uniref:Aromatic ring-hydroxylating dioxygenase subunit alpha n=1 Tax=Amycolatopsis acidicola TaxID=2596893 RepID=A0A5N0UY70_9PSEU|nr:aromatic ring-hydroxylating dioxygenase subunit alpha [Amycolatopsis acidicola]KAA9157335.1 aromatic ring-hydroxylating dioxygenase subunit alpha [Amycolatopsis acidicola]
MTVLNEDVVGRLTEHLRNDTTDLADSDLRVPIDHYVSEEWAAAERDLLRRLPVIAARGSELPKPGDFVTRTILGRAVLIVRQRDGSVRVSLNMCKHRGGRVEPADSGNKRIFMCAYHGWAYGPDGSLRHVPYEESFEPVDKSCNGLTGVHAEERHGFVWVDFSGQGRPVAGWLGPAEEQVASFGLDDAVTFLDQRFTLDINWKIVMDGAYDVLHPKFLHPTGVGKIIETGTSVWKDYGRHGQLFTPRMKMTAIAKSGEDVEGGWKYVGSNLVVYPNSMFIASPDHVEHWVVWPDAKSPSRSHVHIRFLVRPEILDERMKGRVTRSWEILRDAALEEDWPMARSIQENAEGNPDGSFLYGRGEASCQHLHRQLMRDIGGRYAGLSGKDS